MVKTIMVVDDEPDITFTVKQALGNMESGYRIVGANSGEECFELLKDDQIPDLILLDIIMPEINGWDVFAKLKQNPRWRNVP